jgi:trk system potassium uptake protein TrkH
MATRSTLALAYAVRPRVVIRYFGQIALSLVGLTGVPAAVALGYGDASGAWRYGVATTAFAVFGFTFGRLPVTLRIQRNEALVVIALVFLAAALALAWPFTTVGETWIDALFEAMSAVTTTGLSTQASPERLPHSFLFARSWAQWYGGLVIVVLALATLTEPGTGSRRLAAVQVDPADIVSGTRVWARRSLAIYCVLTIGGIALIWATAGDLFLALVHALSAVSTGGFSSFDASLAGFGSWWTAMAVTLVVLAGAISFPLYYRAWQGGVGVLSSDAGVRAFITLGVAAVILLAISLAFVGGRPWDEAITQAPIIALSAQTTSGFTSLPIAGLDPASKLVLIFTMFIGGDSGSTAGGIKIVRSLLVLRLFQLVLLRTVLSPHAVAETRIGGRQIDATEMQAVLAIVLLYVMVIALSWVPFVAAGFDPLDALFEVVSATGTVGLSTGLTSPALPAALKLVLCIDMLMGRLEIVAVLVLFYPRTWFGRRAEAS